MRLDSRCANSSPGPRAESLGKYRFQYAEAPTGQSVSNAYGIGSQADSLVVSFLGSLAPAVARQDGTPASGRGLNSHPDECVLARSRTAFFLPCYQD